MELSIAHVTARLSSAEAALGKTVGSPGPAA